jgi:plasmid stabilization system protein ParE
MAESGRAALWSLEALDDRESIWDYYAGVAGRHTAENVLREIAKVIALIEEHPFAGRARDEVRPGLRSFAATRSFQDRDDCAAADIYGGVSQP